MKQFRIDLHIHTVLSPCGSLEMTPVHIVDMAIRQGLNGIAITDHNSTRQCDEIVKLGNEKGLMVFRGVEINTKEEVHCLAFFESKNEQDAFQLFLDAYLPDIVNDPNRFGDQVWVDREENIMGEEFKLLISALNIGIDPIAKVVKGLNGILIPAHIDRPVFSLISQLGWVDRSLPFDALEVSPNCDWKRLIGKHPYLKDCTIVCASDAHVPEMIGTSAIIMKAKELTFSELRKALHHEDGRSVWTEKLGISGK